jgi:TM2 domain-containing membrane protein YozV
MSNLLYIGPGLGIGTIILVFIIGGIVLFSFGYIFWLKVRRLFKKKDK